MIFKEVLVDFLGERLRTIFYNKKSYNTVSSDF